MNEEISEAQKNIYLQSNSQVQKNSVSQQDLGIFCHTIHRNFRGEIIFSACILAHSLICEGVNNRQIHRNTKHHCLNGCHMPGIFQALYTPYHIECLKQWDEAGSDNSPILLMRKQKFRKVKLLSKINGTIGICTQCSD